MADVNYFQKNLSDLMSKRGITQAAAAQATGLAQATFHRYCNGVTLPGAKELAILADYFSVSMDDFWKRDLISDVNNEQIDQQQDSAKQELAELKHALRVVFRAMSEPFDSKE